MNIIFKEAVFEDVESIISLCNECFQENTSLEYAKNSFKETENDKNQIYIIGLVDDEVVAHVKITIIPTMYEKMNKYAILNHVCVKPEFRRHNLATKMLDVCTDICKSKGCVAIELWSNNFRVPAHECYKKYGFIVNDAKFFSKELK